MRFGGQEFARLSFILQCFEGGTEVSKDPIELIIILILITRHVEHEERARRPRRLVVLVGPEGPEGPKLSTPAEQHRN
jgi:hypothetical protein